MKKLLLLALVVIWAENCVNASTTTRRFYALKKVTGWNETLRIHIYNDASDYHPTSWSSDDENMTYIGSYDGGWVYYKDIDVDDNYISSLQIMFHDSGSNQTHYNKTVPVTDCTTPYLFTIETDASVTTTQLEMYLYENTNHTYTAMATTDGKTFTTTIDNQTSPANTKTYYVVPSFNKNDGNEPVNWAVCYRPNSSSAYSLAFKNYTNEVLITADQNQYWTIAGLAAKFELSVNVYNMNWSSSPCVKTEIGLTGYSTFSSNCTVTIPSGVNAYYASSLNNGKVVLTKNTSGKIAANDGALLVGSGEVTFTPATDATAYQSDENAAVRLVATVTSSANNVAAPSTGSYNYMLANGTNGVGFYYVNAAATSAAGKAYLHSTTQLTNETSGARAAWIFADEDATAIKQVVTTARTNEVFDLQGRRVAQPTKGLYIVNGKKVIK